MIVVQKLYIGKIPLLGLSTSLLVGRTAKFPQVLPGLGEQNLLNIKTQAFSIQTELDVP